MEKTREQLEEEIRIENRLKEEREISNSCYAPIIVKVIVFSMVGIILATTLTALLAKVILKWKK